MFSLSCENYRIYSCSILSTVSMYPHKMDADLYLKVILTNKTTHSASLQLSLLAATTVLMINIELQQLAWQDVIKLSWLINFIYKSDIPHESMQGMKNGRIPSSYLNIYFTWRVTLNTTEPNYTSRPDCTRPCIAQHSNTFCCPTMCRKFHPKINVNTICLNMSFACNVEYFK